MYTFSGNTRNQVFNLTFSDFQGPFSSFTAQMKTPSKAIKFDWINDKVISPVNDTKVTRKTRGITVETQGQHFYGIILKVRNRNEIIIRISNIYRYKNKDELLI